MTDEERNIITSVWNDMVLRKKLEDDPYSLTSEELYALKRFAFDLSRIGVHSPTFV